MLERKPDLSVKPAFEVLAALTADDHFPGEGRDQSEFETTVEVVFNAINTRNSYDWLTVDPEKIYRVEKSIPTQSLPGLQSHPVQP